jgi:hypothetical protein
MAFSAISQSAHSKSFSTKSAKSVNLTLPPDHLLPSTFDHRKQESRDGTHALMHHDVAPSWPVDEDNSL